MRWLFTLLCCLFAGLFLITAALAFAADNWKTGLGGLVLAAPVLYALRAPWPRKPKRAELPRERSPDRAERQPPR